ncbi:MAG: thioredoxin family protein [Mollicutes bacterium]|nr:thioredoxin family protein [Mollicutes bacterium]
MKEKIKGWIFGVIVLIILLIPIITDYYKSKSIEVISYDTYKDTVSNSNFALFYIGNPKSKTYNSIEDNLLALRTDFDIVISALNTEKLTEDEKNELAKNKIDFETGYVFAKDGEVVYYQKGEIDKDRLKVLIDKYYNNIIPEDEIAYKVAKDYKEYKKLVDAKKITMAVFGYESCGYCKLYKPVFNEVAIEYKLNIYYFDSATFNETEYKKIMNSGLKIPKSCTDTGKEQRLSDGFGTPLTIFTKNGKIVDCISGYVGKDTLVSKLKSVGLIK